MARSLKKGPFIDWKLDEKVSKMNESKKKNGHQNMEQKIHDIT